MATRGADLYLPSAVSGTCVLGWIVAVILNSLSAAAASYRWELHCRSEVLLEIAAEAAEHDATRLLTNLMPPKLLLRSRLGLKHGLFW